MRTKLDIYVFCTSHMKDGMGMINFENFIWSKPIKVIYKIIQRDLMQECYWKILIVKCDDRLAQSIFCVSARIFLDGE